MAKKSRRGKGKVPTYVPNSLYSRAVSSWWLDSTVFYSRARQEQDRMSCSRVGTGLRGEYRLMCDMAPAPPKRQTSSYRPAYALAALDADNLFMLRHD